MKIIPTVGRVMLFTPGPEDRRRFAIIANPDRPDEKVELAAIVAYVWSDNLVNLTVHDQAGNTYAVQAVPLVQEGESIPETSYVTWMPYQKAVAKGDIPPTLHAAVEK